MTFGRDDEFKAPSKAYLYCFFFGLAFLLLAPFMLLAFFQSPAGKEVRFKGEFIAAIKNQNATRVQELLADGLNPNIRDADGTPAIILAAQTSNPNILYSLIEAKADINIVDKNGMTVLMYAVQLNNSDLLKEILKSPDIMTAVNNKNLAGWTALMFAIEDDSDLSVRAVLAAGADPNVRDNGGQTPLMFAARRGNEAVVDLLIAHGADINAKNNIGLMALDYAIAKEHKEVSELLLKAKEREHAHPQTEKAPAPSSENAPTSATPSNP